MSTENKVRQYFTLNKNSKTFSNLPEKEKILVEAGHQVAKEYFVNKSKNTPIRSFAEVLSLGTEKDNYADLNQKFVSKLVKYCMESSGVDVSAYCNADGSFNPAIVANPNNRTTAFKEKFNAVIAQVISPIVPALVSAFYMDMADISNIGYGDTARFIVKNNDTFYVTRHAEGILRGSLQRLYNDEFTVNPEPYNIETAVDWYQVAAGVWDFGELVYKVGISFSNKINLMVIEALQANIAAGVAANPADPYIVNGYTDTKFALLTERVRAANANARVTAYGPLTALMAILPEPARVQMYADIGAEWTRVGHLTTYMDVHMVRIPQIMLPNTVNTTALLGIPSDTVYFFADGGYRPIKLVFEGDTFTLDIIPTEAPDKLMGISVTMRMGMGFAAASKFGAMTGLTLG